MRPLRVSRLRAIFDRYTSAPEGSRGRSPADRPLKVSGARPIALRMGKRVKPTGIHSYLLSQQLERERRERKAAEREAKREKRAAAAAEVSTKTSVLGLLAVGAVLILIAIAMNGGQLTNSGSSPDASTPHTAAPSRSRGVCDGTDGNAAVAACHPDDPVVQAACPPNDDGDGLATPSDECLAAVRSARP